MAIEIDPTSGTVTRGEEVWELALDCRDGSVTVTAAGVTHRLRPLRWLEKQRLARLADYGPQLVARQRVAATSMVGPDPDELAPTTIEVLAAVSDWLDDGDARLPLHREALAVVTVDLCRMAGLRPGDLDDRDASEVEAWWRATAASPTAAWPSAASAAPPAPSDPWADATSIRFAPAGGDASDADGSGPPGTPVTGEVAAGRATTGGAHAARDSTPASPGIGSPPGAALPPAAAPPLSSIPEALAPRQGLRALDWGSSGAIVAGSPTRTAAHPLPTRSARVTPPPARRRGPGVRRVESADLALGDHGRVDQDRNQTAVRQRPPAQTRDGSDVATAPRVAIAFDDTARVATPDDGLSPVLPPHPAEIADRVLDELAARLEQAAADLGIEV